MDQDVFFMASDLDLASSRMTKAVLAAKGGGDKSAARLISRLRAFERRAWKSGHEAQIIQIVSSGRRLLGDKQDLRPSDWKHRMQHKFDLPTQNINAAGHEGSVLHLEEARPRTNA